MGGRVDDALGTDKPPIGALDMRSRVHDDTPSSLSAHGLRFRIGKREIVRDVSLRVDTGKITGLLGPNGAGKTTSFYLVVGLLAAQKGQIFLGEKDISRLPMYRRARLGIGYLPQESSVFRNMSVARNILSFLEIHEPNRQQRRSRLEEILHDFSLSDVRDSLALALSGGERRRLEIARTLIGRPRFLLLDEPFSGIDPIAVREIGNLIKKLRDQGLGILITDHNVHESLKIVDRAYILCDGRILLHGTAHQIASSPLARERYLGEEFALN